MSITPKSKHWLIVILVLLTGHLMGQDIHFSQFANSPLNLNPALTGAFDGEYRFNSSFRRQWNPTVNYRTFTISGEKNFCTVKCDSSNCWRPEGFSLGAVFNYDVAGDSKLSLTQLELTGSYNTYLGSGFSLAGGLMLGGAQRAFTREELSLEVGSDPANSKSLGREARSLFDISLGANLHYQGCKRRNSLDLGVGVYHLNQPNTNFFDVADINLPIRYSLYGLGAFQLFNRLDLLVNGLVQFQGPYQEIVLMGGVRLLPFDTDLGSFMLDLNLGARWDDSIIGMIQLHYNMWNLGISYDITSSDARDLLGIDGGLELSVGYIVSRPNPARVCKVQF